MRVKKSSSPRLRRSRNAGIRSHAAAVKKARFKDDLEESIKKELRQKLNLLLKDIDAESDHMLKARTLENLLKYKKLVKDFLNTVIKNAYLLTEKVNFSPRGKQNILILVEKIDRSMEELARIFLNKETDNLSLLEKIGEIRGMLIDTYS